MSEEKKNWMIPQKFVSYCPKALLLDCRRCWGPEASKEIPIALSSTADIKIN